MKGASLLRIVFAAFIFLPLCFFYPRVLFAAGEPVDVHADQVEYFDNMGKVVAAGSVVATQGGVKLTCDQATIYMETKDAYLKGHVRIVQSGGLLKGEEAIFNFQTKKGIILQAESEAGPWRSKGDTARKVSSTSYVHRNGYLTACDFDEPHTRMRAKDARVFLDDRVVLKNVVMYVGKLPVLYLPSYTHPLDDKRPRVSFIPGKDKQNGLFVLSTWRLYLAENLQGQIHIDEREKKGLAGGLDLKYELPYGGNGRFRLYHTNERIRRFKHFWSGSFRIKKDNQVPEMEGERYRVQFNHRWQMDAWTLASFGYEKLRDLTVVKDFFPIEYLQDQSVPQASLNVVRSAPAYGLTFLVNGWVNRFQGITVQRPSIGFNLRPLEVPWLPVLGPRFKSESFASEEDLAKELRKQKNILSAARWQYQSSFSFGHAYSVERFLGAQRSFYSGSTTQELSYSTRIIRWLNLNIPLRFNQVSQSLGSVKNTPVFQQAGFIGANLSTHFFRTFLFQTDFLGLNVNRLRHIVTPTFSYGYQGNPTLSSSQLRSSSGFKKSNSLSFGIEHKLQTKRLEEGRWMSVDLLRFLNTVGYDLEGEGGRGGRWSGIQLDLETSPYPWMSFESDAAIDPHRYWGKPTNLNFDLSIHPGVRKRVFEEKEQQHRKTELPLSEGLERVPWSVGLGWRYSRKSSAQLATQAKFNLGKKWAVGIYEAFDVKNFVTETTVLGPKVVKKIYDVPEFEYHLTRDLHEWTVELVYGGHRQQGESILLLFRLKAAPELPFEYGRDYHQPKAGKNFAK